MILSDAVTIGLTIGVIVLVVLLILFACSYVKAAPDTAIIVSGLGKRKILIGKAGFRIPFLQRIDKLSLRVFQVDIKTDEAIPTSNFINIRVDGVANLKISSDPELLDRAAESILNMTESDLIKQVQQVLQGNMREIIGTVDIKKLVQDRQGVALSVKDNVVPDMAKMGIEVVNFNIQSFADDNHVIENLGIDNISQISKDAAIAKANAERDVTIAKSNAEEAANRSRVEANQKIIEQNTSLSLKESALKQQTDTAKATADAAYAIEEQKRKQEINIAQINADIAKREREVELGQKEVELQERKLQATINKQADAMKQYGEAATLQLILDSNVLPEIIKAYSEPMASAMSKIDSITMYGEGNTAKFTEELSKNGNQIIDGLQKATGLDIKSLIAGYLGGKLIEKKKDDAPKDSK